MGAGELMLDGGVDCIAFEALHGQRGRSAFIAIFKAFVHQPHCCTAKCITGTYAMGVVGRTGFVAPDGKRRNAEARLSTSYHAVDAEIILVVLVSVAYP